ncbi:MAG: hypothetical protein P8N51_05075 [Pseudomonadales bacterium]|jgi:hypothetical protein|nr:hypothetical protein [Pseudomonadales bacterium]MDG1442179.1 hypothetical protein [Pseudomonadales bacterium]
MSADGDWKVTVKSPMGSQDATLTLDSSGDSLSGKFVGPQGEQTFDGGVADGNQLSWNIKMTQPMPMNLDFLAQVEGDTIDGSVKLGAFGDATFTGTRA